jgi:hypothetical protein
MAVFTLDVVCDRSFAPHFTVSVGAGWARVAVHVGDASAPRRLEPNINRAAAMLRAAQVPAADDERVVVSGPDAPLYPDELRCLAGRLFRRAYCLGHGAADDGKAARVDAENAGAGTTEPPDPPEAAAETAGGAVPGADLLEAVEAHLRLYGRGQVPDFAAERLSVRKRAHNFIRSVSGAPRASDLEVEAVRRALATL